MTVLGPAGRDWGRSSTDAEVVGETAEADLPGALQSSGRDDRSHEPDAFPDATFALIANSAALVAPPDLVSRDDIIEAVCPGTTVEDSNLNVLGT